MDKLLLDDYGILHITRQTENSRSITEKIKVSEISHLRHKAPSIFARGYIILHLKNGEECPPIMVPGQRAVFEQLINELNRLIDEATTKTIARKKSPRKADKSETSIDARVKSQSHSDFVAMDIEWTDSSDPNSICEIGMVLYQNGVAAEKYQEYVRPAGEYYIGDYEQAANGVQESLLENANTLVEQWPKIEAFIAGRTLVLHNATNDVNKILSTLQANGLDEVSDFDYLDTQRLAAKLPWIKSKNGVSDLAEFFGLTRHYAEYDDRDQFSLAPHGALEDATLTGEILMEILGTCGYSSLLALLEVSNSVPGRVRNSTLINGFSSPGKLQYSTPSELPAEDIVLTKAVKARTIAAQAEDKRNAGESARAEFLEDPIWWEGELIAGQSVCFTQLMNWDNDGNDHKSQVEALAEKLGLKVLHSLKKDLDLLVVNDPWVEDSAKLRDALSRKIPIPVTTYSVFQRNNPAFPKWEYEKSPQYAEMKSTRNWPILRKK
jgi:DNA polymerase-3 subunit epsilon